MYNRSSFPKSGKWARHLLRLSKVSKLALPEELLDIARNDISVTTHENLNFSKREINAVQYGVDWGGRFVLLEEASNVYARSVVYEVARNLKSNRILIYSTGLELTLWTRLIRRLSPGDRIESYDKNFHQTIIDDTDSERQWCLADSKNITNADLLSQFRADHIVFEMNAGAISALSSDIIRGIASEITRTTFVLMSNTDWNAPHATTTRQRVGSVIKLVHEIMQLNTTMTQVPLQFDTVQTTAMYFRRRGIKYSDFNILEATGTCFDLVRNPESIFFEMFVNNALASESSDSANSVRRSDVVRRYQQHQDKLCETLQGTISTIVDAALAGDTNAINGLESLKTKDVVRNKSNVFYNHLQESNKKGYKSVLVAKNQNLRDHIVSTCSGVHLNSSIPDETQKGMFANFVYPSEDHTHYGARNVKINNLLVVEDLLDLDETALAHVDQVIFAEFLYDKDTTLDLLELAHAYNFKVIFGTLRGTFEEELASKLLDGLY